MSEVVTTIPLFERGGGRFHTGFRPSAMSVSEVVTIVLLFKHGGDRFFPSFTHVLCALDVKDVELTTPCTRRGHTGLHAVGLAPCLGKIGDTESVNRFQIVKLRAPQSRVVRKLDGLRQILLRVLCEARLIMCSWKSCNPAVSLSPDDTLAGSHSRKRESDRRQLDKGVSEGRGSARNGELSRFQRSLFCKGPCQPKSSWASKTWYTEACGRRSEI